MKILLDVSEDTIEHIIDYMQMNSDECYGGYAPLPPSDEWIEFRDSLIKAYKTSKDVGGLM